VNVNRATLFVALATQQRAVGRMVLGHKEPNALSFAWSESVAARVFLAKFSATLQVVRFKPAAQMEFSLIR